MKDWTKLRITEELAAAMAIALVVLIAFLAAFGQHAPISSPTLDPIEVPTRPGFPASPGPAAEQTPTPTRAAARRADASPSSTAPVAPGADSSAIAANHNSSSLTFGQRWNDPAAPPAFARFAKWLARYRTAETIPSTDAALLENGRALARARATAMEDLIAQDPELALQLALPFAVRRDLPAAVTTWIETSITGYGTLAVFAALPDPAGESAPRPVSRIAFINDQRYDAFVYGRRLGEPTRRNIPINGIALGTRLAVSIHPLHQVDPDDARISPFTQRAQSAPRGDRAPRPSPATTIDNARAEPICAVSGRPIDPRQRSAAFEIGGQPVNLCGLEHARALDARLTLKESGTASDGSESNGRGGGEGVQASSYTEGTKRLLIVRVDFSDLPGEPLAVDRAANLLRGLDQFYLESSSGRTGVALDGSGSAITPTLRLPNPAAYYGSRDDYIGLQNDARAAATVAGFDPANYDFDLTCFGPVPGWSWSGLGWVGAPGIWLRNAFTIGVAAHELGHNLGLNHANFWETGGRSIIGPGASVEYGDVYDTMGVASAGPAHFNVRNKCYLNWLPTNAVITVTTSGTYRLEAHDNPAASGVRALKLTRDADTNYWVEFRQQYTANAWMMNGVTLRWAGHGNAQSDLLDTTPGSAFGKNDAALVVGRTFSDVAAGVHITALRKTGTNPESIELAVQLGAFPDNQPPALQLVASTNNAAPGSPVEFLAVAADPDGDELAYHWDFGDGTFGTNGPVASKSWSGINEYRVQCTATDMKGGATRRSVIVAVGTPGTHRISGRVLLGTAPLAGVRVSTASSRSAYTDSDGTYALVGLPTSSYTLSASLDEYTFAARGFVNPVSVGPSANNVDFAATSPETPPAVTTQPRDITVPAGENATFSVTASGPGPFTYQWRGHESNLPGATRATLTLTNVQPAAAGPYSVVITNPHGAVTSSVATLTIIAPTSVELRWHVSGLGSIRGATNGQRLLVGHSYQITAIAGPGSLFSNWTGSLAGGRTTLTFVAESNLDLTATFVPNPFLATRGVFNGLFYETNEVRADRAGYFTLNQTSRGTYSAAVWTRGRKLRASGRFSLDGRATNQVIVPAGENYAVRWTVAQDGSEQISGAVAGQDWSAELLGDRLVFQARTNVPSQAGRYTALLPGQPANPAMPGGDGFGLVVVDPRGTARFLGSLADQTRLVVRSPLSRAGHWPFYAALSRGHGAILGWITFRDDERSDLAGTLHWTRPAAPGAPWFPDGFTGEIDLIGSRYVAPAAGASPVNWPDPIIRFAGADLPEPAVNPLASASPGPWQFKLRVSPLTGLFAGLVQQPGVLGPVPFRGAVVQKAGFGGGYFPGTHQSGQVRIE